MSDEHEHVLTDRPSPELAEGHSPELAKGHSPELAEGHSPELAEGLAFCVNHPSVETGLRCNRCGDPICARCAVHTPVGYRCQNCIREQQSTFYTGLPVDYIIAAVVSFPLAVAGAFITSLIGFFFLAIFIGPAAGALIGDITWRAVGRRRSRYLWVVVCVSILLGALAVAVFWLGYLIHIGLIIYTALAVSAAYGRLRLA
jgi:hypothetical protein